LIFFNQQYTYSEAQRIDLQNNSDMAIDDEI